MWYVLLMLFMMFSTAFSMACAVYCYRRMQDVKYYYGSIKRNAIFWNRRTNMQETITMPAVEMVKHG